MLAISRSGSIADAIASVRGVPASVIPYAAAAALTRTAKAGQGAIVQSMGSVFDRPTRYTLNALRIEPASKDKLVARIAVKNQAGASATRPESYLLPGVEGGGRSEKRFERALRYAGVLGRDQRVMPGEAISLDSFGNVSAGQVRTLLALAKRQGLAAAAHRNSKGKQIRLTGRSDIFIGMPTQGSGSGRKARPGAASGIYRREGDRIRPLFIFTRTAPSYRPRLDFTAVASGIARDQFAAEFLRAATSILAKKR